MSTEIQLTHVYSPDQYTRVVAAWHRLLDNPLTSVDVHNIWTADKVAAEHLYALIVTDGEGTRDDCPIILTLASYSDYGGSCLDASNVRDLDGTPGVQVSTGGAHGSGSAWVQLGELPSNGDDIDTGIGWLESLANTMDGLTDYPLISDETHSEYVHELAEESWDQSLGWITRSDLDDLAGGDVSDFGFTDDEIRDLYYGYDGNEWTCDTATEVRNERHADAVAHVLDEMVSARRTPLADPAQLSLA